MTKERFVTFHALLDHPIYHSYAATVSVNIHDISHLEALPTIKRITIPDSVADANLREQVKKYIPGITNENLIKIKATKPVYSRTRVHMKDGKIMHSSEPMVRLERRFNLELRRG